MTTMARARFREGVEYYDKGEFEQARAAFLQAYALKKHPAVLLNLAWSCLKSGHVREAEQYFHQFLAEGKEITERQRADANDGLNQVHSRLGKIEVAAPAGTDVTIDGEHVGVVPLPEATYVEPGFHSVLLKTPEGAVDTEGVTVTAGTGTIARLSHAGPPAGAPAPLAPQEIPPPAAPAAAAPPPVPPPGAPRAAALPSEHPEPEKRGNGNTGLLVAGGVVTGVAVAGLGTALGMLFARNAAQNNANATKNQILAYSTQHGINPNNCDSPPAGALTNACNIWKNDNSTVDTDATVGNIAVAVGGVAAVGATVIWIVAATRRSGEPSSTAVMPMVDRSTAGLLLSGSF